MKKSTKMIAMLTVITLLVCILAAAIADDRIFTSEVFSIPKERVEQTILQQPGEDTSRPDVVIEGEIITLYSRLTGFDDVEVHYQWQVDRGEGAGWEDVEGANGPEHSFVARKDTILYSWRLTITTDE